MRKPTAWRYVDNIGFALALLYCLFLVIIGFTLWASAL